MSSAFAARLPAAIAVARVLGEGSSLDVCLQESVAGSDPARASAIRSLAFGAVRGYYRHEAILGRLSSQPVERLEPLVRALLSVALFELEDARTPAYAIVDAAVDAAKAGPAARAAGFVNAVLRRYLRERSAIDATVGRDAAARHAAPAWIAALLRADWPEQASSVLAALDSQAPMWLRVDARRTTADAYLLRLRDAGIGATVEARVPYALRLEEACDVRALPGFAEGLASVQDIGAQCAVFPLDLRPGLRVLDACAAPGGKTGLIAERETGLGELVAVDVDPKRLAKVGENAARGAFSARLIAADAADPAAWWDGRPFDRILLDAPCSGLGVIRRHPDIRLRKSLADLTKLHAVQGRLLRAAWSMLASGGRLVYATCTFTHRENRDVLARFLDTTRDALVVPAKAWDGWPDLGAVDPFGRQILPGEAGADGFYYAAITKR